MRLPADENLPRPILNRLLQDGWSLVSMSDVGPGEDDDAVIVRAAIEGLILVTQDRDFGELAIAKGLPVTGVVLVELERLSLAAQVERLSGCLDAERDCLAGSFLVVEPNTVWRRPLPPQSSTGQAGP